jgi:hypothetical protein
MNAPDLVSFMKELAREAALGAHQPTEQDYEDVYREVPMPEMSGEDFQRCRRSAEFEEVLTEGRRRKF